MWIIFNQAFQSEADRMGLAADSEALNSDAIEQIKITSKPASESNGQEVVYNVTAATPSRTCVLREGTYDDCKEAFDKLMQAIINQEPFFYP